MPHAASAQQRALDIQMQLTEKSALLGEPVWVDVTVTNRTKAPLLISMGDACFRNRPLNVAIPEAEPGTGEHRLCGGEGGDCWAAGPAIVDSGKTLGTRYVLAGDFRITHSGEYHVLLKKQVTYATALAGDERTMLPRNASVETVEQSTVLEVRPANPERLLGIEQSLAMKVSEPYRNVPVPPIVNLSPSDMEAFRNAEHALHALDYANNLAKASGAEGLSDYPTAGMEPVFDDWLVSDRSFESYGLWGLYRLNTAQSRRLLAQAADGSKNVYRHWRQHLVGSEAITQRQFGIWRGMAIRALADMGDRSYLPLLERLSGDANPDVRAQAILALGLLGGEVELTRLTALARRSTSMDERQTAIQAIGYTASPKAVPVLISLITMAGSDQPSASVYWLTSLTRHSLPPAKERTSSQYQAEWEDWWEHNRANAHAYGPFDCTGPSFPWL